MKTPNEIIRAAVQACQAVSDDDQLDAARDHFISTAYKSIPAALRKPAEEAWTVAHRRIVNPGGQPTPAAVVGPARAADASAELTRLRGQVASLESQIVQLKSQNTRQAERLQILVTQQAAADQHADKVRGLANVMCSDGLARFAASIELPKHESDPAEHAGANESAPDLGSGLPLNLVALARSIQLPGV